MPIATESKLPCGCHANQVRELGRHPRPCGARFAAGCGPDCEGLCLIDDSPCLDED